MVTVSPSLLQKHMQLFPAVEKVVKVLESDEEVQELLRMANIMAVGRLRYNDHGIVHARIVAGTALELLDMLVSAGVQPTMLRDGTASNIDEVKVAITMASYLHDIGNSVHRVFHEYLGAVIAKDILTRLLPDVLGYSGRRMYAIRQEVMHMIFATEYNTNCLTNECSIVKIADGLDMSEGRARVPYKLGKLDIHSASALSIKRVEVGRGEERPVRVTVYMDDSAGIFQVEAVLLPKIKTGTLQDLVEVYIHSPLMKGLYYPRK
jgi:hypothetical protein